MRNTYIYIYIEIIILSAWVTSMTGQREKLAAQFETNISYERKCIKFLLSHYVKLISQTKYSTDFCNTHLKKPYSD